MIKNLIYSRMCQEIYACDEEGTIVKSWECRDDFVPGYNEEGQPRESLPDGVYPDIQADIEDLEEAYGSFYITTGDYRGRDIHGGGSGLPDPYAARQGWVPTWGCLRMQNEDGIELCGLINEAQDAGVEVSLHVGE